VIDEEQVDCDDFA